MRWIKTSSAFPRVIALFTVLAACGSVHPRAAAHGTAVPRTTGGTTTTAPRPVFVLQDGGATASYIPSGFVAMRTRLGPTPGHAVGPIPGTTDDSQFFLNARLGQSFVMSVGRGQPLAAVLSPWLHPSAQRVHGSETYLGSNPITRQREFEWVVGPKTIAFVGGTDMPDDELLTIADGMNVTP